MGILKKKEKMKKKKDEIYCPECDGEKEIEGINCKTCNGKGVLKAEQPSNIFQTILRNRIK